VLMRSSLANKRVIKSSRWFSRRPLEDEAPKMMTATTTTTTRRSPCPQMCTRVRVCARRGNLAPSVHKQNGP